MAWAKTACWTDLIGASDSFTVLADAGASSGCTVCGDYISMATQVYYAASTAASDLTIEWFGVNHLGASLRDTVSMYEVDLTGVNGASVKGTYQINVSAIDGVAINVTNNEDADGASVYISSMFGTA